ncbi:MBOAT family O-acyltransferase [Chelativorans sp. AA-79]|uniref:MBOAT family O-acyltransferase n=1 Tax=Chelativorans sp. AA-79 TaxID=3028735 RepID=UPI0023F875D0|nr:MBOAT family O-acyltransferase [Chelativorans sp. AA-79]WEX10804.1 MBOAT family protein [Chelativorans sp. AA-79]
MLFTSLSFILFLCATLAGFLLLPLGWRWLWLLTASVVFYASFGLANIAFLLGVTVAAWAAGLWIAGVQTSGWRKLALATGLTTILGALAALKFFDFLASEVERLLAGAIDLPRLGLTAPVGFSFYAFMAAAYLVDVYRGACDPERNAGRFALYVSWFPKILAGPIERAQPFLSQIPGSLRFDPILAVSGLQLIVWGLFKKVVIADNLAPVVDDAFRIAAYASPMELVIAVYFFAFQIYCDFSGYSDIAIGISLLLGIRLMENFRRPYLAVSTAEFWSSRWHISLGHWFRDYLYIPLGGSQKGMLRRYANTMAVFMVSGLWHAGLGYGVGWTFLVWGALNGAYQWAGLATRGFWKRVSAVLPRVSESTTLRLFRIVLTFHLILVSWIFFRADSIGQAVTVMSKIWSALPSLPSLATRYPFTADHALGAVLIAVLVVIEVLDERRPMARRLAAAPVALRWGAYYACIFSLVLLGRWQAGEFIYMQF